MVNVFSMVVLWGGVMNKLLISMSAAALLMTVGSAANAVTIVETVDDGIASPGNGIFSAQPGVTTINFNNGAAPGFTNGAVVLGSLPNIFATPFDDNTKYFTVGSPGFSSNSATFSTGAGLTYLGFYWGRSTTTIQSRSWTRTETPFSHSLARCRKLVIRELAAHAGLSSLLRVGLSRVLCSPQPRRL